MTVIQFKQVYYYYNEKDEPAAADLDVEVKDGEWTAVIGPNGSGKSTLARLCNGLLLPSSGGVYVHGASTKDDAALSGIRRRVGMVFQNPDHQFTAPTVRDDIAFGMENAGVERAEMKQRIQKVAEQTGTSHLLDIEPHRLSGGQKQRAAIAGVLVLQPDIMILDEATSMLDPAGRKAVMEMVRHLHKEEGMTVLSITHSLHEAMEADRVWYMEKGRLLYDRSASYILQHPEWFEKLNMPLPYSYALLKQAQEAQHLDPLWIQAVREAGQ
ncbi:energy-coupling factor transporter ATPase [Salibacterium halotolerans]|uniref:Energy-coupling factor transport system ATP-binding protein n=1 Tax=Salibacterium halotolerans TaxID=1884432 RepID=A0A1I5WGR8_9BACI|nr:energy-coupling factor transporter ATPase [Salibacterium halotolerans]SFQ18837.1 energy-coupling factor transport system ATP-binding protein [Salibacterium halotolerans]